MVQAERLRRGTERGRERVGPKSLLRGWDFRRLDRRERSAGQDHVMPGGQGKDFGFYSRFDGKLWGRGSIRGMI